MGTLWEQLGGTASVERIVSDFLDGALADPQVNYTRDGRFVLDDATIRFSKKSAVEFLSAATGGPLQYSGRSILDIHRDMRISHEEFDAACGHFRAALQKNGIGLSIRDLVMAKVEATRPLIVHRETAQRAR